jgi:multidrug efflux pump subunit AcrA (membrane-fusion protein)
MINHGDEHMKTNRPSGIRFGLSSTVVIVTVVVIMLGFIVYSSLKGEGDFESGQRVVDIHTVKRGDFKIKIPANGELTTSQLIEVRNPLEISGVINKITEEGTYVKKGDVLFQLNDDQIKQKIKDLDERMLDQKNRVITSEQSLAIAKSAMASDIDKADLNIEIAELALQAWREGEHIQNEQKFQLKLQTTTINSERLVKRFEEAQELVENGFISRDEYERDRIAMIESAAAVKEAEISLDVYKRFTSKQDEKKRVSDLDQASSEKGRVKQRHQAEMVTQTATVDSDKSKLESSDERMVELKEQLNKCIVLAPTDGLVVYRSSMREGRGRDDQNPPAIGTNLSPNQLVILLPNTSQMVASVKVSEALSGRIKSGMPATVFSDAFPNMPIEGEVGSVSVMARDGGWRDPNRRDYTVLLMLKTDPSMGLKPSMRCRAEIELGLVNDVISVPIQSVFREGADSFVYVPDQGGWSQRKVEIGKASELAVEITGGLDLGERILLRKPDSIEIIKKLEKKSRGENGSKETGGGRPDGPPSKIASKKTEATKPS